MFIKWTIVLADQLQIRIDYRLIIWNAKPINFQLYSIIDQSLINNKQFIWLIFSYQSQLCLSFHYKILLSLFVCLMVINATFNNISVISWRSVLLEEETGVPWENHWTVASHWHTLSHNVEHLALTKIWTHNISGDTVIGTDCIGKFNYHVIMAPPTPNTSKSGNYVDHIYTTEYEIKNTTVTERSA